jgi:serine/threonine protein kinase
VIHRDLKLDNIMVFNGKIKIIDFGFSIKMKDAKRDFSYCGTPCYMAPEIISRKSTIVHSESDVWALGVILYKMTVGVYPFRGKFLAIKI